MTNPAYPAPPPNMYQPAGPAPIAPGSVTGAFATYLVAALLSIVGAVLLVSSDVWNQAIASAGDTVTTSGVTAQALVNTVKVVGVVFAVIFIGLYLLFAFKMRAGRNWARIVLTVLSALSILSSTRSGSVQVNGVTYRAGSAAALGWVGTLLAIVAIVLMFLPASNAYFAASKAARTRRLG